MNIDKWTRPQSRFLPEKPAIVFNGNHPSASHGPALLTFSALEKRVQGLAGLLEHHWQLGKGDRIAWLGLNHPDMFALLLAAARLGVIVVPMNWRLSQDELAFIFQDCRPVVLFYDQLEHERAQSIADELDYSLLTVVLGGAESGLDHLLVAGRSAGDDEELSQGHTIDEAQVGPEDPCLIVYTSGTTGRPKGAVLSHGVMICNALMSQHMYDLNAADRVLNVLPLFHVGGINIQPLPALMFGATLYLHQQFDPVACVQALESESISLINTVPTILQALQNTDEWTDPEGVFPALKSISIGSTDVPRTLIDRAHAKGIALVQVYGATETGPIAIYQRPGMSRETVGSIGLAGLLCDVALMDEDGREVPLGESGEICIKGNNILTGYWNNESATNAAFRDGWFRTGDVAHLDNKGNYWFDDRLKHVIISGGENIYPAEVERVINAVSGVDAVSVVGLAHDKWGQVPVAVVQSEQTSETLNSAIHDACRDQLARFKQPASILLVDALPRNAMGKIVVDQVRALVESNPVISR